VFVRSENGVVSDLSPAGVSIRSRVHEYGGGAVCLMPGKGTGAFAYVDLSDQRVWVVAGPGTEPRPISPEPPDGEVWAHGGLGASADGAWVVAVREVHCPEALAPQRCIVALGTLGGDGGDGGDAIDESVLAIGHTFYGAPRLDGVTARLATVVWDHPDMPWDASRLEVIPLEEVMDDAAGILRLAPAGPSWSVAGGSDESVGQPTWGPRGDLLFASDRHGWWQPYRHGGVADGDPPVRLSDRAAEFHGADFVLGLRTMARLPDGSVAARATSEGRDTVVVMTESAGVRSEHVLEQPCVAISAVCAFGDAVAIIGATAASPPDVWVIPTGPIAPARRIRPPRPTSLDPAEVSNGEPFHILGRSGRSVFGAFYAPTLFGVAGPSGASPPMVVWCHGGPTSSANPGFDPALQYFTTRGFAVACVDYAGSTGYGRGFRCSLWGQWGVFDAEDCLDAAHALAASSRVDPERMAIRGGSAGGLTALNALSAGQGFRAAACWYGVTDLLGLAAASHDFEAHYLDRLVGPLPKDRALYEARSPVNRAAEVRGSVLLLQGTDDRVVPPSQAESLQRALAAAGGRCEIRYFPGEGHGFRRAETLADCLQAELEFYQRELDL
jgi:dipeptidyl aminopeptidase/acylaminoacyl peptidase